MRARRTVRPTLETLSSRIAPGGAGLLPYDNPLLAPVIITDTPPPTPHPLDPVLLPPSDCRVLFVGDGEPPAVGELPPVLQA